MEQLSEQNADSQSEAESSSLYGSERKLQLEAEREFRQRRDVFRRRLESVDIWGAVNYDEIVAKIGSDPAKRLLLKDFREDCVELADLALKDDANLYEGFSMLKSLGDTQKIKERVHKGHREITGELSYDLACAVLDYGDDAQAEALIRDWIMDKQSKIEYIEHTIYFQKRLAVINDSFNPFAKAHGLPERLPGVSHVVSQVEFINAAVELKKREYDVAVGVLGSGVYLAEMLDYLGQNTRYMEWHRGWKREPIWKKIGGNTDPVTSANKILVCEHDVETGATLDKVSTFLTRLRPQKVDVSFWVDMHSKNAAQIDKSDFYDEQFLVSDINKDRLVENLNFVVEYAKQDKNRLLV